MKNRSKWKQMEIGYSRHLLFSDVIILKNSSSVNNRTDKGYKQSSISQSLKELASNFPRQSCQYYQVCYKRDFPKDTLAILLVVFWSNWYQDPPRQYPNITVIVLSPLRSKFHFLNPYTSKTGATLIRSIDKWSHHSFVGQSSI